MASDSDSGTEYEVQKILQQRKRKGLIEYLVRWRGFGAEHDSWEPVKNLKDCKDKIQEFNDGEKKTPSKKVKQTRRSRSASSSRSRSRSRGRSTSKSRKSPSRRKASPVKKVTQQLTSTRSQSKGRQETTTEKVTKTVEEFSDDETAKKTIVTETRETLRTTTAAKRDQVTPLTRVYQQLTSDYTVLVIFVIITLITFSFMLEKYISMEDCWNAISKTFADTQKYVQGLWHSKGK